MLLVGIDNVVAGVLPTKKANVITALQSAGRKVAIVGDGINDTLLWSLPISESLWVLEPL